MESLEFVVAQFLGNIYRYTPYLQISFKILIKLNIFKS